ncbi:MAG: NAD+ synthase [Planctomycetota bacterium]
MRIALAQLNPVVGDVTGNVQRFCRAIDEARRQNADVVVTSELMLIGYPPRDLLLRSGVVEACEAAVDVIAKYAPDMTVVVGTPRRMDGVHRIRNSVAVCHGGSVVAWYDKQLLPGYDVFDEDRYFDPGETQGVVDVNGHRIGLLTCEDLWCGHDNDAAPARYDTTPLDALVDANCSCVLVLNASPFNSGKPARHREIVRDAALRAQCPVISVNQVGANDDLIFDGRSMVVLGDGTLFADLPAWQEAVEVVDLDDTSPISIDTASDAEDFTHALALGLRDYVQKTGNDRVLLGLSGGIDSALTATIAALALGPTRVFGVMMPSRYSSDGSVNDAQDLADRLGLVSCPEIAVRQAHDAMRSTLEPALGADLDGLADENLQARLRGMILMALSNAHGGLVLATSNKSELAVGYSTLYGDMCGAVSVIGDLLKTEVYDVSRWINANATSLGFDRPPIPESSITKPPSAELRPDQKDEDSLPPYEVLDAIIARYIDADASIESIVAEMPEHEDTVRWAAKAIDRTEYKRHQASIILKVAPRTFGRGRPMPIVMRDTASRAAVEKLSTQADAPPRPILESSSDS